MIFGLVLIIIHLVYWVIVQWSIGLLQCYSVLYLNVILSMEVLISTLLQNQQQAMLISFLFIMIFIFLSRI